MSKPLTHIVYFNQKDSFDVKEAARLIAVMKKTIPGLLSLEFGPKLVKPFDGYNDRSQAYTHALVSTHKDVKALKVYTDHPDHLALVSYIRAHVAAAPCCIDFVSKL